MRSFGGRARTVVRRSAALLLVVVVAAAPASVVVLSGIGAGTGRDPASGAPGRHGTSGAGDGSSAVSPAGVDGDAGAPALLGADESAVMPPPTAQDLEESLDGTPGWQIGAVAGSVPGLAAFADRVSVLPGESVGLYVDTPAPQTVSVRALRIGSYAGAGAREVWSGTAQGLHQPSAMVDDQPIAAAGGLRNSHLVRAPWAVSAHISTLGWPEGHYLLRLDAGAAARYVPLTVRSASARGRVLLVAAAMTWQAYNAWGNASLYGGDEGSVRGVHAQAVSFDRPYSDGYGSGRFLTYDAPVATVAQGLGVPLAWATDVDLAEHPDLLDGAAAVVIGGHSEYWTAGMRDAVEAATASGTNLAVFGANTAYWRVRLVRDAASLGDGDRIIVATKSSSADPLAVTDPHGATGRFRDAPMPRPEERLTGERYDCYPAAAAWTVTDPQWWGYDGTGVTAGLRLEGLVGPESDRVYNVPDRPRPTEVVAYTKFACGRGSTAHTAVYGVRPSGAAVFSVGTMYWPCALQQDECRYVRDARAREIVRGVTRNVITAFAEPQAGRRHPATDSVNLYWLPAVSTTGAS